VRTRLAAGAAILLIGGVAAWQGVEAIQANDQQPVLPLGNGAGNGTDESDTSDAVTPEKSKGKPTPAAADALSKAETPMADRVAVLGLLNKRNGEEHDLTLKPGQAVRVGDVVVRLRACETSAPWEAEPLTGAFVQVDTQGRDTRWRRVFSGWLYKESPSLNVVEHPIYDVWPKSCAMTHPDIGPDTVLASSVGAGDAPRSIAKKSPDADAGAAPPAAAATPAPSAPSNNPR
jgi:hypothetical protein